LHYIYNVKVEWFETLVKGDFFIPYSLNLTTLKKRGMVNIIYLIRYEV